MNEAATQAAVAEAVAAVQRGDLMGGFERAARAVDAGARHPILFKLRAGLYERQGRLPEAAADFRAALELAPDDFSALNGLGLCLARLGQGAEAVSALRRASELAPDFAPARLNLGWALEGLGEMLEARDAYQAALRLDSTLARADAALAMLAARRGDWADARRHAEAALRTDPRQSAAALALATADIHQGRSEEADAGLARLLSGELTQPSNERALALSALGDLRDRQGRYGEAFEAYVAGKAVLRSLYAPTFTAPGRLSASDILERILDHYPPTGATPEPQPSRAQGRPSQVFLLGFPRSGTTLLGQVLDGHPELMTLEEGERLADAANAFLVPPDGLARLDAAGETELDGFRRLYWERVRAAGVSLDGRLLVDKLPTNTLGLPLIARLFPDACVIYMERDPRDVLLSCLRQAFAINTATWELTEPASAAAFLDLSLQVGRRMAARRGPMVYTQRYERLVENFTGEATRLAEALGVDGAPIARFPEAPDVSAIATPSARQIAAGLNARSVGQWRNYREALSPVLGRLQPWVDAMGYSA